MKSIESYFKPVCTSCFIIAEVAQTHDGSLGQAHAFIDAVAETGADAIKFQTHIDAAECTSNEPFRVK
jgi:N-acetylneuraminate synthase